MSTLIEKMPSESTPNSRYAAYVELTKLRISVMVLITFAVSGIISVSGALDWVVLGCAMIGMLAISASGNAMNMFLERYSDFLMFRTKTRPLPAQKLTATEVATFGAISFGIGVAFLFGAVNWQTGLCGLITWVLYVVIYTPLKTRTSLNTEVGAVAGALPVIMGCLATTQTVPAVGWGLFLVLLCWQFPHFMAIAWMYREDYERGGLKMITVTDPTGKSAGRKAIWMALVTTSASLIPALTFRTPMHSWSFALIAVALGAWYFLASWQFANQMSTASSKKLLRVSVIYLPIYMMALVVTRFV